MVQSLHKSMHFFITSNAIALPLNYSLRGGRSPKQQSFTPDPSLRAECVVGSNRTNDTSVIARNGAKRSDEAISVFCYFLLLPNNINT